MSRYSSLLESSTTPLVEAAPKSARGALVGPSAGSLTAEMDMSSFPLPSAPKFDPGDATAQTEAAVILDTTSGNVNMPLTSPATNKSGGFRTDERTNGQTLKRSMDGRNVPTIERTKIRHTFDILADQLLTLKEIAIERQKTFGPRVLLGELVQEALDMFIDKERIND